jgi:hypothetical protein
LGKVGRRPKQAINLLLARIDACDPKALRAVGQAFEKMGRTEAITYLQRAADAGDTDALQEATRRLGLAMRPGSPC